MKVFRLVCISIAAAVLPLACAAPPAPKASFPPPTPTPGLLSRTNPNIVEEDDVHFVERYLKEENIRLDGRHFRSPIVGPSLEFFKEDEKYFYVFVYKRNTEAEQIARALTQTVTPAPSQPGTTPTPAGPPLSEFEDISPAREPARIRLEAVSRSGLPTEGMWRASFVVADMNGDGIPDIVAPPSRLGDANLHVWIGDGKGSFSPWPLEFIEDGKPNPSFSLDYGGVAVGDIDGDGHLDVVAASHGAGLVSLFGAGKGRFRVVTAGLPTRDFSSQAIALVDADGDGKLDIVASTDSFGGPSNSQIRVFLYRGAKGWEYNPDGIVRGTYSNTLHAWDFDRDGKSDVLTGSHHFGALDLLWKNTGKGGFEAAPIPPLESWSYHFAMEPGTFGRNRTSAFAGAYQMFNDKPQEARAIGITIYSFENGTWTRHRVWRKKSGKSLMYAVAMGDLDGDGLDDIVFADTETDRLRIFFQRPDSTFVETEEKEGPALDSPGQCIRLADVNRDGRLDIILSKTVTSDRLTGVGGWDVYLNKRK